MDQKGISFVSMNSFAAQVQLISESHAGFRKIHSTTDNIFISHSLVDLYFTKKKRLFCTCVVNIMADILWFVHLFDNHNVTCHSLAIPFIKCIPARCIRYNITTGRWFSPGFPDSSTNKTDRHDIAEILLKVALNTINLNQTITCSYYSIIIND
jgi:hypothetical protein